MTWSGKQFHPDSPNIATRQNPSVSKTCTPQDPKGKGVGRNVMTSTLWLKSSEAAYDCVRAIMSCITAAACVSKNWMELACLHLRATAPYACPAAASVRQGIADRGGKGRNQKGHFAWTKLPFIPWRCALDPAHWLFLLILSILSLSNAGSKWFKRKALYQQDYLIYAQGTCPLVRRAALIIY